MSDVAAPVANVWDLNEITAQALAVLRLGPGDVDVARIEEAALIATVRLDGYLDAVEAVDTTALPDLVQGAVELNIEVYRTKDAPWGVLDAWSADTIPMRISSDRLRSIRSLVIPRKQRWGIG
jgi:hypothetical protein